MPSNIDFSKPIYGTPTTQSVRDNFEIAQIEITDLQNITEQGPFVPLDGGIMLGFLELYADPRTNLEAATKQYVDALAFGASGTIPDSPLDGMFYARGGGFGAVANDWKTNPIFTAVTIAKDKDNLYFGIGADVTYNHYNLSLDGSDTIRYNRTTKILELLFGGAVTANFSSGAIAFSHPLSLNADPTIALGAATKQYVDNSFGNFDAPNDGKAYLRLSKAWHLGVADFGTNNNVAIKAGTVTWNFNTDGSFAAPGYVNINLAATQDDGLWINAVSGHRARSTFTVVGVRAWTTGTESNGSFAIGDNTAGVYRVLIDIDKTLIQTGTTSDPLYVTNTLAGGGPARTRYTNSARDWSCGVLNDGRFAIGDETAGASRILIGTDGVITLLGYCNISNITTIGGITVGSDPLHMTTAPGTSCRVDMTVASARRWTAGVLSNGHYSIADETGASVKLDIGFDAGGGISLYGPVGLTSSCSVQGGFNASTLTTDNGLVQLNKGSSANPAVYFNEGTGNRMVVYFDVGNGRSQMTDIYSGTAIFIDPGGNFYYNGGTGVAYKTGGGSWTAGSDIRIKRVINEYKAGLEEVILLRPVRYVYRGNDGDGEDDGPSPHAKVALDNKEFIGLVAQEVETIMPEMIGYYSGHLNGKKVDDLRSMDPTALTYAFINAFKTMHSRLTILENLVTTGATNG